MSGRMTTGTWLLLCGLIFFFQSLSMASASPSKNSDWYDDLTRMGFQGYAYRVDDFEWDEAGFVRQAFVVYGIPDQLFEADSETRSRWPFLTRELVAELRNVWLKQDVHLVFIYPVDPYAPRAGVSVPQHPWWARLRDPINPNAVILMFGPRASQAVLWHEQRHITDFLDGMVETQSQQLEVMGFNFHQAQALARFIRELRAYTSETNRTTEATDQKQFGPPNIYVRISEFDSLYLTPILTTLSGSSEHQKTNFIQLVNSYLTDLTPNELTHYALKILTEQTCETTLTYIGN